MCCGADGMHGGNVENGVIWHEMGRLERGRDLANVMLEKIWKSGADKRGEKKPDLTRFIEYEYNEGVKHIHDNADIPDGGFENSLYFRKVQLSEMLARQMHPDELKKLNNFPLRKTDYTVKDCDREMEFHYNWRKANADKYPLNSDSMIKGVTGDGARYHEEYFYQAIVHSKNQIRMCAEYLEAVANAPVHLSDIPNLPDLDALTRSRN